MKKMYVCPVVNVQGVVEELMITMSGSETDTTQVHLEAPQDPDHALSRRDGMWMDEE